HRSQRDHHGQRRPGGERQHQPGAAVPQPVRASPRLGAGHRREGDRQPDGGDSVGGNVAGARGADGGGAGTARGGGGGAGGGVAADGGPGRQRIDGGGRGGGGGGGVSETSGQVKRKP